MSKDRQSANETAEKLNAYWKKRGRDARAKAYLDHCEVNGRICSYWTVKSHIKGWWA